VLTSRPRRRVFRRRTDIYVYRVIQISSKILKKIVDIFRAESANNFYFQIRQFQSDDAFTLMSLHTVVIV
jgi:hypothetical protein